MGDVDKRAGDIGEISIPSQFSCGPETVLKNKIFKK